MPLDIPIPPRTKLVLLSRHEGITNPDETKLGERDALALVYRGTDGLFHVEVIPTAGEEPSRWFPYRTGREAQYAAGRLVRRRDERLRRPCAASDCTCPYFEDAGECQCGHMIDEHE